MKRFIIIGILALCTLSASAQSVKGLIEQYRHEKKRYSPSYNTCLNVVLEGAC